jgi:hypothetical protein
LLTVPANVALTVQCPGLGPDDADIRRMLNNGKQDNAGRQVLKQLPWFVQMALYLYKLDQVNSCKNDNTKLGLYDDAAPALDARATKSTAISIHGTKCGRARSKMEEVLHYRSIGTTEYRYYG